MSTFLPLPYISLPSPSPILLSLFIRHVFLSSSSNNLSLFPPCIPSFFFFSTNPYPFPLFSFILPSHAALSLCVRVWGTWWRPQIFIHAASSWHQQPQHQGSRGMGDVLSISSSISARADIVSWEGKSLSVQYRGFFYDSCDSLTRILHLQMENIHKNLSKYLWLLKTLSSLPLLCTAAISLTVSPLCHPSSPMSLHHTLPLFLPGWHACWLPQLQWLLCGGNSATDLYMVRQRLHRGWEGDGQVPCCQ